MHGAVFRVLQTALLLVLMPASAPAAELPRSGNLVFDRVIALVNSEFHDETALDRFNETAKKAIGYVSLTLPQRSSIARVDAAIDRSLASLQASHNGRFKPDTIAYFELSDIFRFAIRNDLPRLFPPKGDVSYPGIGLVTHMIGNKRFVSDVYDGSPAAKAGVVMGDEMLSVDGLPYREIASFQGKVGQSVDIHLRRRADAAPTSIKVAVERLRPLQTFEKAIENSIAVSERNGRKIGYLRFWTLSTRDGLDIVAHALSDGRLSGVDGVIVDLRGRWGGGAADAAELFVGDTPTFRLIPRHGQATLANVRWRGPVVALIDDGTRSGLELFAYAMRINGIPLVGQRTAGALLAGRAYILPDDSLLEIAVSDAVIDDNVRLEGNGIAPDIPVDLPLAYAAGRDPQREAAESEMLRLLSGGSSERSVRPGEPPPTR
ncbi:carboxyl-terminal protease [Sinorhizobium sp. A49]|uniref:S41 family peptidase n=1 Tax=Sinorhizobium sp. A49 TaxID=1945861 RepID=UPI0009845B16|nr:S41 family peptidase [Sinorhizobium sp. A49]OOG75030.1 carboxyl-terminal protease [Sinorhizobium sp. A49]